jgi:hypothetical protein
MATIREDQAVAAWGAMQELPYVLDRSLGVADNLARMQMIVARSPDERSTWECDIAVKFGADNDDEYRLVSGYEEFASRYIECARSHGIAIRVRCLGASEASR